MTIKIHKKNLVDLNTILESDTFKAKQYKIQYGIQYKLECGILCNAHYSEKNPEIWKITFQKEGENLEKAELLKIQILTLQIDDGQQA